MMNSAPVLDTSLYQLVLKSDPPPQSLVVSPATLKSLMRSLIEVLIEQQLATTLWVKLPPGKVWQAEIELYQNQVAANIIYFSNQATIVGADANLPISENLIGSRILSVQLSPANQLKREYFILVMSAQFCGLILAHRPNHQQLQGKAIPGKHSLLTLISFNRETVQQILPAIKQAISPTEINDLLTNGELAIGNSPSSILLTQLLAKQVQQQEEIWRNAVTSRQQATSEENLQGENATLLNDLRLKDEFLSQVAQELRTPLTNMKTALTLLESAHLKPAQRQRYMHVLHTECDRQSFLITSLLDMVQLNRAVQQTTQEPVHLADIVPGVVSTYQPLAQEKGIQLGYTVPSNLPTVSCQEAWVRQIVINLLHNGIKFTHQGGQVLVRAKQQGKYIQIEFRDTGIGIVESGIPKIFDRFYRGRSAVGEEITGAGLGLTIVQQLLLRCGGSISVTSKLGEGSIFKVLLPITS